MMLRADEYATLSVPIGVAAEALGVHPRTLRLYEKAGLIAPRRRRGRRYYSTADLTWLQCLRTIVHDVKISIPALARLLRYESCWEIRGCDNAVRERCPARRGPGACWEKMRACCRRGLEVCRICPDNRERKVTPN